MSVYILDKQDNAKRAKKAEQASLCADTAKLFNASDQQTDSSAASVNKLSSKRGRTPQAKKNEKSRQRETSPRRLRIHVRTPGNDI